MNRQKRFSMLALLLLFLSGCGLLPSPSGLISAPSYPFTNHDILQQTELLIKDLLPEGTTHYTPTNPTGVEAIRLLDFDQDGKDEILVTYRYIDRNKGTGLILLKHQNGKWVKWFEEAFPIGNFDWAAVEDFTGDNHLELLIGVGLNDHYLCRILSLKSEPQVIYRSEYSYLKPVPTEQGGVHLALLTKMDHEAATGSSIKGLFGRVLKWNGFDFVLAEESYPIAYSMMEPYYRQELTKKENSVIGSYYFAEWLVNCNRPLEALELIEDMQSWENSLYEQYIIKTDVLKAQALFQLSRYEEGEAIVEALIEGIESGRYSYLRYHIPYLFLLRGRNYMATGQLDKAKEQFELCIEANRNYLSSYYMKNSFWNQMALAELERIQETASFLKTVP